jgi:hypothetical protein
MNVQTISAEANSEQVDKFVCAARILSHSQKMGRALRRLRCGQEDQGQEAAHSCRHSRSPTPRYRSSGRHSRSRWRRSRDVDTVRHVSIFEDAVRRQRISKTKFAKALTKVLPHLAIEIVKRSDQVSGFVVLPKRWIPVDPKQISLTSKSLERRARFCFLTTLGST